VVSRILDNLKNNVDTTLADAPELTAPDMSAKSGVTSLSAGTPKLSMKTATQPAAPAEVEEDPFGAVAEAEPETSEDDPFAPQAHAGRAGLEELLAGARLVVVSLEKALQSARDHERELTQKLREL
jgi:hypothetical protein